MVLPARRHDGQLRFAAGDAEGGLLVTVGSGRVELGRAAGQQIRVRWTIVTRLTHLRRGREVGPRVRSDAAGLRIEAGRARLRIDVPDVVKVTVRVRRGEITSWGAGAPLVLNAPRGRVVCRELTCPSLRASGRYVNVHFAAAPEQVEVEARESLLAVPDGAYSVVAPPGADVELSPSPAANHRITVSGGPTRIVAAQAPLPLNDEPPGERAPGG